MIKENTPIVKTNTRLQKTIVPTYRYPLNREISLKRHQTSQRHIDRITLFNLTHLREKV